MRLQFLEILNLPFRSFRERVCFLLSLFSSKEALEIKAVWSKHFNFPYTRYTFNVAKAVNRKCSGKYVFWFFFFFFCTNSWEAPVNNFVFPYFYKLEGYTSTTEGIKITSSYQMFQPGPQLATMQTYYFKKHLFFQHRFSSYFCRLYCWLLYYSASLWINLLSIVCAYTLKFAFPNLLKLAY